MPFALRIPVTIKICRLNVAGCKLEPQTRNLQLATAHPCALPRVPSKSPLKPKCGNQASCFVSGNDSLLSWIKRNVAVDPPNPNVRIQNDHFAAAQSP